MDWNKLKIDFTNKQDQLMKLEFSHFNLKEHCKDLFNDLPYLSAENININELEKFTIDNFRIDSSEIIDKYEEHMLNKVLAVQAGFFLSFYSFCVTKFSYQFNDISKDDFSQWLLDILSSLNLTMDADEWKIFMQNFVLSFYETLSVILIEIYEIIGLDLPPELVPAGSRVDDDPSYLNYNIQETSRKSTEVITPKLTDLSSIEPEKKSTGRMLFGYNSLSENSRTITRKSTISDKSKSRSKKREKRRRSPNKQKILLPETPNYKKCPGPRIERVLIATEKKLKGRVLNIKDSPIPAREAPSTPTILRKLRSANALTDNILRKRSNPISNLDFWVLAKEEEERSLTQFSSESLDGSINFSSIPVKRFKSCIFNALMSPVKPPSDSHDQIDPTSVTTSSPRKHTPLKRSQPFFSPIKTASIQSSSHKSPAKAPAKKTSPRRTGFFSPIKSQQLSHISSPIVVIESNTVRTPLKSCLKSPIPKKLPRKSTVQLQSNRRRTSIAPSSSIFLSPKVKQRSFLGSEPPQNFCEDTVYMDTHDFIQSSRARCVWNGDYDNPVVSPLPAYLNDQPPQATTVEVSKRPKLVSRRSSGKNLFNNIPETNQSKTTATTAGPKKPLVKISSNIDTINILAGSRRSNKNTLLNFNNLDPETDNSNSFLI